MYSIVAHGARDLRLERDVAVKRLRIDSESERRPSSR